MEFCSLCTRVFDRGDSRTMKFDDFIQCCVMLRSLTEGFKRLDTNRSGTVTISYEQVPETSPPTTSCLTYSPPLLPHPHPFPPIPSSPPSRAHQNMHPQFLEMAIDNTM